MQNVNVRRVLSKSAFPIGVLVIALVAFAPPVALAGAPTTQTYFICPSVSTHNPSSGC